LQRQLGLFRTISLADVESIRRFTTNGHKKVTALDNQTRHAHFPHLNPLSQAGEEANESLREFYVKDFE